MTTYSVTFTPSNTAVAVPVGTLLNEAAQEAGLDLNMPCGGQGRCGRCAVLVEQGTVRRRSNLRLSADDVAQGYCLACQTVIEGDARILIPPQEKIERRLVTDRTVAAIEAPLDYDPARDQVLAAYYLELDPPSMDDQTDDWSRVQRALRRAHGIERIAADLGILRTLGRTLRAAAWQVTAIVERGGWDDPDAAPRLVDVLPGR
ncbi:MAG: 2Fe-2S iron-sulfur cluster binding domain-containing protein, partial [Caldilinea sp.]|nr:2Fe-2S iron-sulfur cluster binding domain-containing protein [Caldilinea sp.]